MTRRAKSIELVQGPGRHVEVAILGDLIEEWSDPETTLSLVEAKTAEAFAGAIRATSADALIIDRGDVPEGIVVDALLDRALPAAAVDVHRTPPARDGALAQVCSAQIYGRGVKGYYWAYRHLIASSEWPYTVIGYGDSPDHVADLRTPDSAGPFPVAVLIHGGGWEQRVGHAI
jgi:hypothetical protein